jgi:hypothetical protein
MKNLARNPSRFIFYLIDPQCFSVVKFLLSLTYNEIAFFIKELRLLNAKRRINLVIHPIEIFSSMKWMKYLMYAENALIGIVIFSLEIIAMYFFLYLL